MIETPPARGGEAAARTTVWDGDRTRRALAIGPGLGRETRTRARPAPARASSTCPRSSTPTGSASSSRSSGRAATVLTPHSGELARLLGEEADWVDAHRLEALGRAVERFRLRRAPQGRGHAGRGARRGSARLPAAIPSLATAGTGDVLTGVVAAFLAKGMEARLAAAAAATAHTQAARPAPYRSGLDGRRPARGAARASSMHRSEITIDLGALRRNARACGRCSGEAELWAVVKADGYGHGAVDVARAALDEGAARAVRGDRGRGARAASRVSGGADPRHGPDRRPEVAPLGRRGSSWRSRRRGPGRMSGPPQARHRAWAGGGSPSSRTPRRQVVGLMTHLATADSDPEFAREQLERFERGDETPRASDPSRREQRRRAAASRSALRRCALRDRALRALAVRRRPGRRRPRAGRCAGSSARPGQAARSRRVDRLRPAVRRRGARRGSASSRSATRTASAAT